MKEKFWILEYNRKCATFLGWSYYFASAYIPTKKSIVDIGIKNNSYPLNEMKFHSDWNWIISVLNNINKLNLIQSEECNKLRIDLINTYHSFNKNEIIESINQFIDNYNKKR